MRPATLLTGTPSHEHTPVDPTPPELSGMSSSQAMVGSTCPETASGLMRNIFAIAGGKGGHLLGDQTCRPSRPLRGQSDGARSEFEGLAGTAPKSPLPCDHVLLEGEASAVGAEVE